MLGGINYFSNHGTSQGIIPRFFLNFKDMSTFAFMGDKTREELYRNYEKTHQEAFTNFYDMYFEIQKLRLEYINGLNSGKYFKFLEKGKTSSDTTPEITIRRKIKEFFMSGRQLVESFGRSGLLDDEEFKISKFLLADAEKVEHYKSKYSKNFRFPRGYTKIIDMVLDANSHFKVDFFSIRGKLVHDNLQISPFRLESANGRLVIYEPTIKGVNVFVQIEKYFNGTFDLIEDIAAYFFGINAHVKSHGKITLLMRKPEDVDPANFRYRYTITLDVNDSTLIRIFKK